MRTMRGYCRRQARREVYKAYNAYHNRQRTNVDVKVDEFGVFLGWIAIIGVVLISIIGILS